MNQIELDNLRQLLLSENAVDVGLEISKNLDDISFNEMLLGRDWIKCIADNRYKTNINRSLLVINGNINCDELRSITFFYDNERYTFNLIGSHKYNLINENHWLRNWLTKTVLKRT